MAQNDLEVWQSHEGGHLDVMHYRMNAAETFRRGEPVSVNGDGELTESADDPTAPDFIGVALEPAGYSIGGTATTKNPRTGAAYTTGDMIAVVHARPGQRFICANFATDGAGTAATPTLANALGEQAGLTLASGSWFVDTGTTNNVFRIVDVLDSDRESIQTSGGTGASVVVEVVASQVTATGDPAA